MVREEAVDQDEGFQEGCGIRKGCVMIWRDGVLGNDVPCSVKSLVNALFPAISESPKFH